MPFCDGLLSHSLLITCHKVCWD